MTTRHLPTGLLQRGIRHLGLLLLLLLQPALAAALAPPDGVETVTEVEGISEYRLDNGLRVLLFPDASKPTVTVNITYLVGSRHEGYGETGMAHLLEHLLFKGTPTHADILGEMRRRGIGFNASTGLDRTNYYSSFAADVGTLDWLLALEADRMVHARIAREDLDSEMTVVRNELEAGENNPVQVLRSRMGSVAHLWHNYGNAPIGARSDVEHMPIERLQAFYRRHYRPDNATLLVAGRIEPAAVLTRIAAEFGAIARPDTPVESTYTREPPQDGEREVVVRRVGETRYLGLVYHVPAARHADHAALTVLASVLGDTPTGRLHKTLVEGGLATWVAAANASLDEPGTLLFLAEAPKGADAAELERQLLALVEDVAGQPVSAEEVADVQRRYVRGFELTINDANRLAMALSESIALGDWRLFFLRRDRLEAVTADDVNRVAAAYLTRNNRTLGRFEPSAQPERVEVPEAPPASELVAHYRGRAAVAAGEAFDATPTAIDARTRIVSLANGTRLVLLPKSTRGGSVVLNMSLRFGDEAAVLGMSDAASFAASMLMRGSRERSREAITRRLDELRSTLGFGGHAQGVSASATSTREQLPALLELLAELLQKPAFPASEFEQLRSQAITGLESAMTEPQTVAGNALSRHFNPWPAGHPYYAASFEEQLAALRALTLDEVRAFHAAFYGAGDGEIVLVGDFDAEAVQAQLDRLLGDWNPPQPFVRIPQPHHPVEAIARRFETPDKANAVLLMRADLPMSDSHADYPALLIGSQILGGGMKSRLADRVRHRDGLSYSVSAQFSANAQDERASLVMFAIAAPQNVAGVEAAVREEFARLLADGIAEAELRDAVDGLLRAREHGRGEDPTLAAQLRGNVYLGRTMAWSAELDEKLRGLTPAAVQDALRRQFGALRFSVFSAGDFSEATTASP